MAIELNKEVQTAVIASIQRFFDDKLQTPIGNLQAREVLDYFLKEIAPSVYNQAIAEAQQHLQAKVLDLDVDCHEREFDYWKSARAAK